MIRNSQDYAHIINHAINKSKVINILLSKLKMEIYYN